MAHSQIRGINFQRSSISFYWSSSFQRVKFSLRSSMMLLASRKSSSSSSSILSRASWRAWSANSQAALWFFITSYWNTEKLRARPKFGIAWGQGDLVGLVVCLQGFLLDLLHEG